MKIQGVAGVGAYRHRSSLVALFLLSNQNLTLSMPNRFMSSRPNVSFVRSLHTGLWSLALVAVLCLGLPGASAAQSIEMRLPSVNGEVGETVDIDIRIDDVSGEGILAYSFTLPYDASVLNVVGASADGTVTPNVPTVNTQNAGEVSVAFAASSPLSGEGTLLTLEAELVGAGSAPLSLSAFRFERISGGQVEEVNVEQRAGRVSVAQQAETQSVGADSTVQFGNTGVSIQFSGVTGSGDVNVQKFADPAFGTGDIAESNVSSFRYMIESTGDLSFDGDTELRFDASTLEGATNPDDVVVYSREKGGDPFTALSTSYDADANELVATIDSFSEFVMASDSSPLPVEMASFEAVRDGQGARLQWTTASETNNSGFAVQHRTGTAPQWSTLGFVEGHGTTTQPNTYTFATDDLQAGTHRFRLRQVDVDGTETFSREVSVVLPLRDVLQLTAPTPNPVSGETHLQVGVQERGPVTVAVFNVRGQRVATLYEGIPAPGQKTTVQFDTDRLASGTYFVRATSGAQTRTQRVTVVK